MISDPCFPFKNEPKSSKKPPKAEKVDSSKSRVLPAWEHDSEGFRAPKIIKIIKNRSQGQAGENTNFQTPFSSILELSGDPIWAL